MSLDLKALSLQAFATGDLAACSARLADALGAAEASGSLLEQADIVRLQGNLASYQSNYDHSLELLDVALNLYSSGRQHSNLAPDAIDRAVALTQLSRGCVLTALDRHDEAHAALRDATPALTASGDDDLLAILYESMQILAENRGQSRVALALGDELKRVGGRRERPLAVAARPPRKP